MILADIWHFVSGAHEYRRGGTIRPQLPRCSWYRGFSMTSQARMSREAKTDSRWNLAFFIRSTWLTKWWHDRTTPPALLPIQRFFYLNSIRNIWRSRKWFSLKFRTLYQEHMTTEDVARISHASCDAPDKVVSRKIFQREYLKNQNFCLAEISYFVSGAHDYRRGGTMKPRLLRWWWYSGFMEKIRARIFQEPEVLSRWNFVLCIRST